MSARYYIQPHFTREGEPAGWDVREDNGFHDVCICPCDTEEEARDELKAILAKQEAKS